MKTTSESAISPRRVRYHTGRSPDRASASTLFAAVIVAS